MPGKDIFLSYASEDRDRIGPLVHALERTGWTVFWDRTIPPGKTWRQVVGKELDDCRSMVVVWSHASVESDRVLEEADRGSRRGILVPVRIDEVETPLGFRSIQTADLVGWDGSSSASRFRRFVMNLSTLLGELPFDKTMAEAPRKEAEKTPTELRVMKAEEDRHRQNEEALRKAQEVTELRRAAEASARRAKKERPESAIRKAEEDRQQAEGAAPRMGQRVRMRRPESLGPPPILKRVISAIRAMFGGRGPEVAHCRVPEAGTPVVDAGPTPVLLGVAAPHRAAPGSHFTALFTAYVEEVQGEVRRTLRALGDDTQRMALGIPPARAARWLVGAPITVRLSGEHFTSTPERQSFEWNGRKNLISFDVGVRKNAPETSATLCFHVFLAKIQIAFVPVPVAITTAARPPKSDQREVKVRTPNSAFASYSSLDSAIVTGRLSTLTRFAPQLDIFQDCLDLKPGEEFKPAIARQITERELFLLFWSRNAAGSKWVKWEYQTARKKKGFDAIMPMPLEDPEVAKPPRELADKHLRDRFMIAGYGLTKVREVAAEPPA